MVMHSMLEALEFVTCDVFFVVHNPQRDACLLQRQVYQCSALVAAA
jgi:hypothetical protein